MSQVKISGNASGTGVLTIAAPNTNTDRTLNLPDNTGSIITTASTVTPKVPIFSAYLSSNQSIPHNTFTKANINTEVIDSDGWYDNATNYRFTPQQSGYYFLSGGTLFQFVNSATVIVSIFKNGSESSGFRLTQRAGKNSTVDATINGSAIVHANGSTDYFEFYVFHTHGSNRDINGNSWSTRFQGYLIRAD